MVTRYNVSTVALQDSYVAKRCPVRAQVDLLRPCEPLPVSPVVERRFVMGRRFEAETRAAVMAVRPDAVAVAERSGEERQRATLDAMRLGAVVIVGGRLPADDDGRRVGQPDLMVRAADAAGYRPVDVKFHRTLGPAGGALPAHCSDLGDPTSEASVGRPEASARRRRDDLLQLAHYQRISEAAGLAAGDGRYGGIIGTEGVVTWYDLDAAIWKTPSSTGHQKARSTMEIYDFEFDSRVDILAVAARHRQIRASLRW
jgi:hypothetical protein